MTNDRRQKEGAVQDETAGGIKSQPTQPCPQCGWRIGAVAGMKEAMCRNCGFKDPCCE